MSTESSRLANHRRLDSQLWTCSEQHPASLERATTKDRITYEVMQSNRSFCIESLIASRDKFSPKFARDDAELDDEASSDLSDRESPRLPQQSTPFSVNDILNPDKFTRERSPSESPPCSDAKKVVWHPWMSATRYNRPQKIINGKRILIHVYKLPLRGK